MLRPLCLGISIALSLNAAPALATDLNPDPGRCSAAEPEQCLNGVSSGVTALDSLRVSSALAADSRRRGQEQEAEPVKVVLASSALSPGLLADEGGRGFGAWAALGFSSFEGKVPVAPYEADLWSVLVSADRAVSERWTLGLSAGFERLDTDTRYNGGGQTMDGWTLAPYASYRINEHFSVDAGAGWSWLDTEQDRIDPASAPGNPMILRASYDSRRQFALIALNGLLVERDWVFGGRLGYLHSSETQDGYTEAGGPGARTVAERKVRLNQLWVGGDVARGFGAWEPYALAAYRYDLSRADGRAAGGLPGGVFNPPEDDDEWEVGLGLRYFGAGGVSGYLEWIRTVGRDRFENDSLSLVMRIDF